MTDNKLDQILKAALVPEIQEADIKVKEGIRKKELHNKKLKSAFAVAACLVLFIAASAVTGQPWDKKNGKTVASKDPFAVIVEAAEITEDNPVYLGDLLSNTFGFTGWVDGKVGFVMEMPVSCKGENIDSITYSIEGGAFSILECSKDEHIIIDSDEYKGDVGEVGLDDLGAGSACKYVSSYSVTYENQKGNDTFINICGNQEATEEDEKYLNQIDNPQKKAQVYNKIFEDVTIICTVCFKDGTEQTKKIGIDSEVMSYGEFSGKSGVSDREFLNNTDEAAFLKVYLK